MISVDAAALEAKYAGRTGPVQPQPTPELGKPTTGIPQSKPIPEGEYISQRVGRGMAVVPPKQSEANQPQVAVVPPQQTARTTIGTIIEPSATNPIRTTVAPDNGAVPEPEPPKVKLDLGKLIMDHIWELGGEKAEAAQKFYDRSHDTLHKWLQQPALIPLGAIQKFMARKPGIKAQILEELEPHFAANGKEGWTESYPNRGKLDATICAPVLERPTLPFLWAVAHFMKKNEMGLQIMSDTVIHRSRNMLAHRFLKGGTTWSVWIDGDMAVPLANPEWYRWITGSNNVPQEYTNYDAIDRLLTSGKPIIGGVYASRKFHGQLVIQPEIRPRNHEDKLLCNNIRAGTARGLVEVDWLGFGCCLVHRQVFLEVQRHFPNLAPESEFAPWRFFQPESDEGEDEAFSRRVKACGIPLWLDTQLICGHIGQMTFMPEHTQPVIAL
jgi:hypothetical protein